MVDQRGQERHGQEARAGLVWQNGTNAYAGGQPKLCHVGQRGALSEQTSWWTQTQSKTQREPVGQKEGKRSEIHVQQDLAARALPYRGINRWNRGICV